MIDDVARALQSDPNLPNLAKTAPVDVCSAAIAETVRLILELTAANAALDYDAGVRIRHELECGLREAHQTFQSLSEGPARVEALQRLDGLSSIAERQLAIAPTPSATAIAAAAVGDLQPWCREAELWKADRLGYRASEPRPAPSPLCDTRPVLAGAAATPEPTTPTAPEDLASVEECR